MPSRTITNSAEELVPENKLRRSFIFQNEDSAIDAFIMKEEPGGLAVSATVHDHRLGPGGNITLNFDTDGKQAVQARWTIVAASGTPRISFFETEEIER